jgi:hypothetical protein
MIHENYTPKQALERVKLLMKYDTSQTLTENIEKTNLISEQMSPSEAAKIASKVHDIMVGDVETEDLDNLSALLSSSVFGKKLSDGSCAMQKVIQYYAKSGAFGTAGGGLLGTGDLLKDIAKSTEWGEPEFDDVKKEILLKINNELKSFCGGKGGGGGDKDKVVTPRVSKYKDCTGTYQRGCKSSVIGKVQGCLGGLTVDNVFGPKTEAKLKEKGFAATFTDADVDKICGKKDNDEITGVESETSVSEL